MSNDTDGAQHTPKGPPSRLIGESAMIDSDWTNRFLSAAEFFALAKARLSLNTPEALTDPHVIPRDWSLTLTVRAAPVRRVGREGKRAHLYAYSSGPFGG